MRSPVLSLLVLAACAQTQAQPEPAEPAAPPAEASESEELLSEAERELKLWKQQSDVMYRRHFRTAQRYRDALELEPALREVESALRYKPKSEEAVRLRADVRRMLGDRAGEVETVIEDAWEARQVRSEERKVSARRKLAEAERALAVEDYDRARRAYESVLFIVDVARREGDFDRELARISAEAKMRLEKLQR
ncbi:MAG: hypothetical protein ACYTDU_03440 [Planctomycetota bacterium]|jgi:hypothetical protein